MRIAYALLAVFAPIVGGCSHDEQKATPTDMAVPVDLSTPVDLAGTVRFHFVMNNITLPDKRDDATKYLYDVDGNGTKENKLVQVIDALQLAGGGNVQPVVDQALIAGTVIQLLQLQTFDRALMNDTSLSVAGFVGLLPDGGDPAQLYTGKARITVDLTEEPAAHVLQGLLASGKGDTDHLPPGAFPMHFPLEGQPPVPLTVYAAHAQFHVDPAGKTDAGPAFTLGPGASYPAMLNGGLSQTQIHDRLIPAIANLLNSIVRKDPMGANAMTVLRNFDKDGNQMISNDEVEMNPVVSGILSPDLDLFDDKGNFAPNQDKVKDSLSFGVAFTAVGAVFDDQASQ